MRRRTTPRVTAAGGRRTVKQIFFFSFSFQNYNNNNKTESRRRKAKKRKRGEPRRRRRKKKKKVQSADMKGANVIRTATVEKKKNISYLLLNPPCLSVLLLYSSCCLVPFYLFLNDDHPAPLWVLKTQKNYTTSTDYKKKKDALVRPSLVRSQGQKIEKTIARPKQTIDLELIILRLYQSSLYIYIERGRWKGKNIKEVRRKNFTVVRRSNKKPSQSFIGLQLRLK